MPGTQAAHNEPREYDPWDDAVTEDPSYFWGQVSIECYYDIGIEVAPKDWQFSTYDPRTHGSEDEVITAKDKFLSPQVEFTIIPLDPTRKIISRKMSAKYYKRPAFQQVVYPSILTLEEKIASIKNLTVGQFRVHQELSEMWVQGEFVPEPNNEGWTTLKFLDVYPTEAACRTAAGLEGDGTTPGFDNTQEPEPQSPPMQDKIRAQMAGFLPTMFAQSGNDYAKFLDLIAGMPALAQHFDATSPEVEKYKAPF